MKKPTILYVPPCWPLGQPFGSQVRILHIARALQEIGRLRLVVVDLVGSEPEAISRTAREFEIECHTRPEKAGPLGLSGRVRQVVDARTVNPYGLVLDPRVRGQVFDALERVDLIWFSYLRPMSCFDRWRWPRSVMDIDDIPSTYERTLAQNAESLGARCRARWRMWVWRRRERRLAERFTVLAVSSEPDFRYVGPIAPLHIIPNGFTRPEHEPVRRLATPPRLGFIGKFDYPPNAEGMRWFAKECWPQIKRALPETRLRLVGKDTDGPLKPVGPDIDALGWMDDTEAEIATWAAMIVPVRIGAGTRVKVLEAFSRKCPVVGTRIGVFGHNVTSGQELLLADSPADFASACLKLLREPAEAAALAERAWTRFLREWTWEAGAPRVWAAAEDALSRSGYRPLASSSLSQSAPLIVRA
jgi:polysaccharide biosynthesis protein PslH